MAHSNHDADVQEDQPHTGFNPVEAARLLGLSAQQKKLADGVLAGMNATRAATAAGYSGKHASATASKAMASEKVRSYLAWARAGGHGVPDGIASEEELMRLLSRIARGADKQAAIKATEALIRVKRLDREAAASKPIDPMQLIVRIANLGEGNFNAVCIMLAQSMAADANIAWSDVEKRLGRTTPPEPRPPAETPGDESRRQHIERMNQNPLGAVPPPPSSTGPGIARGPEQSGGAGSHAAASPLPHINPHGTGTVQVFGE